MANKPRSRHFSFDFSVDSDESYGPPTEYQKLNTERIMTKFLKSRKRSSILGSTFDIKTVNQFDHPIAMYEEAEKFKVFPKQVKPKIPMLGMQQISNKSKFSMAYLYKLKSENNRAILDFLNKKRKSFNKRSLNFQMIDEVGEGFPVDTSKYRYSDKKRRMSIIRADKLMETLEFNPINSDRRSRQALIDKYNNSSSFRAQTPNLTNRTINISNLIKSKNFQRTLDLQDYTEKREILESYIKTSRPQSALSFGIKQRNHTGYSQGRPSTLSANLHKSISAIANQKSSFMKQPSLQDALSTMQACYVNQNDLEQKQMFDQIKMNSKLQDEVFVGKAQAKVRDINQILSHRENSLKSYQATQERQFFEMSQNFLKDLDKARTKANTRQKSRKYPVFDETSVKFQLLYNQIVKNQPSNKS